jgi:hypothetical protein
MSSYLPWYVVGALALAGCGVPPPPVVVAPPPPKPVTVVETSTPGVAFVIVSPQITRDVSSWAEHEKLARQYILLCDGRPADGMHCEIPTEAAIARISQHPKVGPAKEPLDIGLGIIEGAKPAPDKDNAGDKDKAGDKPAPDKSDKPADAPPTTGESK